MRFQKAAAQQPLEVRATKAIVCVAECYLGLMDDFRAEFYLWSATMRISTLLLATLMSLLSGCYSLSPVRVAAELSPAQDDSNAGYLVGVVGVSSVTKISADVQSLFIRKRGTAHTAQAYLIDNWMLSTKQEKQENGKAGYFVMPLTPGEYEIYNVQFKMGGTTMWKKEDFSVPMKVEPGKAYYIGDYRSNCFNLGLGRGSRTVCQFLRSNNFAQDSVKLRQQYPHLPDIEPIDLGNLEVARPFIMNASSAQGLLELLQGRKQ